MRFAVLIPALNEAGNVARLIGEIPRDAAESTPIVLIDNGSTDGTADVARAAGAQVVAEAPARLRSCVRGKCGCPG